MQRNRGNESRRLRERLVVLLASRLEGRAVDSHLALSSQGGAALPPLLHVWGARGLKPRAPTVDQSPMEATFAGVLGAIMGSFLNVVTFRLPRRESLVTPRSRCPSCGAPVRPYDNIPILSWLLLRGHCRDCSARISPRYPLVEAGTALLCAGAVLTHSGAAAIALSVALVLILVPAALIDLEHRIIPNRLTARRCAARARARDGARPLRRAGAADRRAPLPAASCWLAALAYPGGMGMGDVKLAGVMGLFLGAAVAPALLVALLTGVLLGAAIVARKGARAGRKTAVPFGPFLALGGIVAIFAGQPIVHWYVNHFIH